MELKNLLKRAIEVREQYNNLENRLYGRVWTHEELALGFVVDVGTLMRLIMAKEGIRDAQDVENALAHELADCLWSVLVLSHTYRIDIEKAFLKTMDEIEERIKSAG